MKNYHWIFCKILLLIFSTGIFSAAYAADDWESASTAFFMTYLRLKNGLNHLGEGVADYGLVLLYFFLLIDLIFSLMNDWRINNLLTTIMRTFLVAGFFTFLITGVSSILSKAPSQAASMANVVNGSVEANPAHIFDYGLAQSTMFFAEAAMPSEALQKLEEFENGLKANYPNLVKVANAFFDSNFIGTSLKSAYETSKGVALWMDNPVKRFLTACTGFFILCVFTIISVNILLTYLAFLFLCYAGVFLLGFGGSKITRDMAIAYLRALFAQAIIYYGMAMTATFCKDLFNDIAMSYLGSSGDKAAPLAALCVVAYGSYKLINELPIVLGSIAGGRALNGLSPQGIFSTLLSGVMLVGSLVLSGGALTAGVAAAKAAAKAGSKSANGGEL